MVRGIETVEGVHEKGYKVPFVVLDLEQAPFSDSEIEGFDQLVQAVFKPQYGPGMYPSKYIVRTERMYVFQTVPHNEADKILVNLGVGNQLQSAGDVGLVYHPALALRTIEKFSPTLAYLAGTLPQSISDSYKMTVLAAKLGQYFKVR